MNSIRLSADVYINGKVVGSSPWFEYDWNADRRTRLIVLKHIRQFTLLYAECETPELDASTCALSFSVDDCVTWLPLRDDELFFRSVQTKLLLKIHEENAACSICVTFSSGEKNRNIETKKIEAHDRACQTDAFRQSSFFGPTATKRGIDQEAQTPVQGWTIPVVVNGEDMLYVAFLRKAGRVPSAPKGGANVEEADAVSTPVAKKRRVISADKPNSVLSTPPAIQPAP